MGANFLAAISYTKKNEGGWSNNPKDPGGQTYRGIARRYWKFWPGWKIIDEAKLGVGFPKSLEANVQLQVFVDEFYHQNFWYAAYEQINSQAIATKLFDHAVNMNTPEAVTCLQEALVAIGVLQSENVDGKFGPKTLAAVNVVHPDDLMKVFIIRLKDWYEENVRKHPEKWPFLAGWLARCSEVPPEVQTVTA